MLDLTKRKYAIGGSDVAALFGVDEFKDAFSVWYDRKGRPADERPTLALDELPAAGHMRMLIGKMLEGTILELYSRMTHRAVRHCSEETTQHPTRPYMIYTPDALCMGEKRGVEVKVVFLDQWRNWSADVEQIPLRVILQCYWYMAALDYDLWDVCVYLAGSDAPRIYTVERDQAAEASMLKRVEEWFLRYIVGDEQPPLGNSKLAARWLREVYPEQKYDIRDADEEETKLLREYIEVRVNQDQITHRRGELETAIKAAIQDHEGLRWDDGATFTWRKTRDQERVNWRALSDALLAGVTDPISRKNLLQPFTSIRSMRRISVNHPELSLKSWMRSTDKDDDSEAAA